MQPFPKRLELRSHTFFTGFTGFLNLNIAKKKKKIMIERKKKLPHLKLALLKL